MYRKYFFLLVFLVSLNASFTRVLNGLLDVALLLPWCCAVAWVCWRQRAILANGVALLPDQCKLAQSVGVRDIGRVRVVVTPQVPVPLPAFAARLARRAGWMPPAIAGMTLGHGIVLRADCADDRRLLAHELTHVAQYERLGVTRFLRQYLREGVWPGYPRGSLEIEAKAAENRDSMGGQDVIPYMPIPSAKTRFDSQV